jgi:hypothetical protein
MRKAERISIEVNFKSLLGRFENLEAVSAIVQMRGNLALYGR